MQLTFYFFVFISYKGVKIQRKVLYSPPQKIALILVFMQLSRRLDYVILLHATILGMTLKGLVRFCSQ